MYTHTHTYLCTSRHQTPTDSCKTKPYNTKQLSTHGCTMSAHAYDLLVTSALHNRNDY